MRRPGSDEPADMLRVSGFLLSGVLALSGASVAGEIYRWVDKDGNVHFSENPPPSARASKWKKPETNRVTILERQQPPASPRGSTASSPVPPPEEPDTIAGKYEWQWRRDAQQLQSRIDSLEEQLDEAEDSSLSGFPSSWASSRFDARKAKRIERLEAQIEEAEEKLETFEDQARLAGVPRGWLR